MTIEPNFYMLAPYAVTETELVSGPPDAEDQVYNAGTTYAIGDEVWYSGKVFRSKVDSNIGNTPVDGVNWADLGTVDEGASVWASGTTYSTGDFAVYEGQLWKSAADTNTGNTPAITSAQWVRQGATNRFKAFDSFLDDEASLTDGLTYSLEFASFVSQMALMRAAGNTARVTVTDDTEGVVYDQTFSLIDDSGIIDAWEYCFGPFIYIETILVEDMPPYANADLQIVIDGDECSVAQIVVGVGVPFGAVAVGAQAGIESYSLKERGDFNRATIVARPYSDTAIFPLKIPTLQTGYVKRRLAERDSLATLYFMSGGAPYAMIAYGFFKDFDILHATSVVSDISLEIEGLG